MHVIYSEVREVSVRLGRGKLLLIMNGKREGWMWCGDEDEQNTHM